MTNANVAPNPKPATPKHASANQCFGVWPGFRRGADVDVLSEATTSAAVGDLASATPRSYRTLLRGRLTSAVNTSVHPLAFRRYQDPQSYCDQCPSLHVVVRIVPYHRIVGLSRKQRVAGGCRLATDIVAPERSAMATGPATTTLVAASMALGLVSGAM